MKRTPQRPAVSSASEMLIAFLERLEVDTARWQVEGLPYHKALAQAYAGVVLELEEAGIVPKGYLRDKVNEV